MNQLDKRKQILDLVNKYLIQVLKDKIGKIVIFIDTKRGIYRVSPPDKNV